MRLKRLSPAMDHRAQLPQDVSASASTSVLDDDGPKPLAATGSASTSSSGSGGGGVQLLRIFGRSGRRQEDVAAALSGAADESRRGGDEEDEDSEDFSDDEDEKHRMERVYREISVHKRRKRLGSRGGAADDIAWVDVDGNVVEHVPTVRRTRRNKKVKAGKGGGSSTDKYQESESEEITTEYLDAMLVKPDEELLNKYTRFFLNDKLEALYQEYTAVNWFLWARGHIVLWIVVHTFVSMLFEILPYSGFQRMDMFLFVVESFAAWGQYLYLFVALPFALLPNKVNPFQKRWRSWVCLIMIVFNFTFQMWLASASQRAVDVFKQDIGPRYRCMAPDASEIINSTTRPPTASELVAKTNKQRNMAFKVTSLYAGAMVQVLAVFVSAFSFILVVSIRLEFVQSVIVGCTAIVTYVVMVSFFDLAVEWITAVAYLFAVVLLLILSHSSDRNNRRSFLSQLLVEKENESLKSYLTKAEAVLMNDAACDEEKKVVCSVLDNPQMKHLDMVRIPFSDIKLLQAIGRGAMGDVIKAKYFGTIVVCKRMRRENITEAAIISFREEIELMSSLRHPNIVQLIGATWDNCSNVCIVMEYLENGDMHSVLHSNIGRNFTWADPLLKMAIDAAQGMLYLHSQETPIVHRDLKSVNIFCSATFGCKVGDFGLSRRYKKDIDALTTLVGTPFWLAPEIIRNESYGPSADVFSFGIVLTELETRRTPYHDLEETGLKVLMRIAQNKLRPSLPLTCWPMRRQLILDCLNDDPARRPKFSEVLKRLQGPVQQEVEGSVFGPATHERHERRGTTKRLSEVPRDSTRRDFFFEIISNVHNPMVQ